MPSSVTFSPELLSSVMTRTDLDEPTDDRLMNSFVTLDLPDDLMEDIRKKVIEKSALKVSIKYNGFEGGEKEFDIPVGLGNSVLFQDTRIAFNSNNFGWFVGMESSWDGLEERAFKAESSLKDVKASAKRILSNALDMLSDKLDERELTRTANKRNSSISEAYLEDINVEDSLTYKGMELLFVPAMRRRLLAFFTLYPNASHLRANFVVSDGKKISNTVSFSQLLREVNNGLCSEICDSVTRGDVVKHVNITF
jgi:hypothetical protein